MRILHAAGVGGWKSADARFEKISSLIFHFL
jgi:hypothetical protein